MKQIVFLISIIVTAWSVQACQENGQKDGEVAEFGSQTHFLKQCKTDDACDGGLFCVCGVCTDTCDADDDCRTGDATGKCVVASDDQGAGACVANARIDSACMPECNSDEDCETHRICDRGVCAPTTGSPCLPTASCSPERPTCAQATPVGHFVFSRTDVFMEGSGPSCPGVCMVYKLEGDISPNCERDNCADPEEVEKRVYCSCRCDLPEGATGEPCTCPDGMSCSEKIFFEAAGPEIRGSYCIKDGT